MASSTNDLDNTIIHHILESLLNKNDNVYNILEAFPNYADNYAIFESFITEIRKNKYNTKQLIAIARFLYQLANLQNLNISANPIKTGVFNEIYNHLRRGVVNNARFNNSTKRIISKILEKFRPFNSNSNNNKKLQYIIKQFIAQYLISFEGNDSNDSRKVDHNNQRKKNFLESFRKQHRDLQVGTLKSSANEQQSRLHRMRVMRNDLNRLSSLKKNSPSQTPQMANHLVNNPQSFAVSAVANSSRSLGNSLQLQVNSSELLKISRIKDFFKRINKDNIHDILTEIIDGQFLNFLEMVFNYICTYDYCYITDETIFKILTYIVYFFVNQNMQIPDEINKNKSRNKNYDSIIDGHLYSYLLLIPRKLINLRSNKTLLHLLYLLTKQKEFLKKKKVNNPRLNNNNLYT